MSSVKADGTQISYTYDLDGIRTKKTVNGTTTEYFVNGTTILAQKTGNDVIWFIYDVDGQILGFTYNNNPYYYIKNIQGDVVKIADGGGVIVASYTYDPWGKITSSTGTMADINPIRYRGYYYDSETGLYYLNSRYYDPDTCRFINADGYVSTGQGLLGFNMFAYCLNNPINHVDPNGEFTAVVAAGVGITLGEVAVIALVATEFVARMYLTYKIAEYVADNVDLSLGKSVTITSSVPIGNSTSIPADFPAEDLLGKSGLDLVKTIEGEKDAVAIPEFPSPSYTVIYRYYADKQNNLAPRAGIDYDGLSFSTIPPRSYQYPCVATTVEAVNSTGMLVAVRTTGTHYIVRPLFAGQVEEWRYSGMDSIWSQLLSSIVWEV